MEQRWNPETLAARCAGDARSVSLNGVFNFVYGWMTVGLVISGIVAWFVSQAVLSEQLPLSSGLLMVCSLAEIGLVIGLSAAIHKLSPLAAAGLFAAFAALNGVTLSVVFLAYAMATVQTVFFIAAGTFAGMALIGTVTKRDLSKVGGLCMMALWGIIIASIVNWFLKSPSLTYLLSYVGVALFVGLTAWDAQKVRLLAEQQQTLDGPTVRKLGLLCALSLYLDFVNLFLMLLRLFGGKGRD